MDDLATYRATVEDLDHRILGLARSINAQNYEMLVLVREFDERCGWLKWGFTSCAEWLHWRCDLSLVTAHEKVRMANALKVLPLVSQAFSTGELSYSKVRAITRVATRDNEASLLAYARTASAARVEDRCRQLRQATEASVKEARAAHEARGLHITRADERGLATLTAELPAELAMLLSRALDKAVEQDVPDGPELSRTSWRALRADALMVLAKHYLAGGEGKASSADRYQVVVHVDEAALRGKNAEGARADLPIETVRRLSCDGSIVALVSNAEGEPLSVGRKRRTVTTTIRRALSARERSCAFPGCTHTRFLDAHHLRHWARGGETGVGNLTLLCDRHHTLVHEGGFTIERDARGAITFRRPDGRVVPRLGYRRDDMVDETTGAGSSAEDSRVTMRLGPDSVRDVIGAYVYRENRPPDVAHGRA